MWERGRQPNRVSTRRGGHTQWGSLLLHGGQDDVGAVDLVHVPAGLGLVEPLSSQVLPLNVQLCAVVEYVFHFAERDDKGRKDTFGSRSKRLISPLPEAFKDMPVLFFPLFLFPPLVFVRAPGFS